MKSGCGEVLGCAQEENAASLPSGTASVQRQVEGVVYAETALARGKVVTGRW